MFGNEDLEAGAFGFFVKGGKERGEEGGLDQVFTKGCEGGGESEGERDFRTRSIRAVVVVHNNIVYLRKVNFQLWYSRVGV